MLNSYQNIYSHFHLLYTNLMQDLNWPIDDDDDIEKGNKASFKAKLLTILKDPNPSFNPMEDNNFQYLHYQNRLGTLATIVWGKNSTGQKILNQASAFLTKEESDALFALIIKTAFFHIVCKLRTGTEEDDFLANIYDEVLVKINKAFASIKQNLKKKRQL